MKHMICGLALVAACAAAASASVLMPGDIQFKAHPSVPGGTPYSTELPPFGGGANLVDEMIANMTGEFEGTVRSQVFRDPATGFLAFHYTIALTDMNSVPIVRATMDGWEGINITDAGADATGSSGTFDPNPEWTDGDPLSISRDPTSEGIAIQWRTAMPTGLIGTVVGAGDVTSVAFFVTDTTLYTTGEIDLIDTAVTAEANVFVPQIPEPASLALLLLGAPALLKRRVR
jgi:hypothetical protein